MKTVICDRCKRVCEKKDSTEITVNQCFSTIKIDLCKDCKRWLYKELGIKEEWEEKY